MKEAVVYKPFDITYRPIVYQIMVGFYSSFLAQKEAREYD
jgi:hypothetical protein